MLSKFLTRVVQGFLLYWAMLLANSSIVTGEDDIAESERVPCLRQIQINLANINWSSYSRWKRWQTSQTELCDNSVVEDMQHLIRLQGRIRADLGAYALSFVESFHTYWVSKKLEENTFWRKSELNQQKDLSLLMCNVHLTPKCRLGQNP